jgi:Uma2 family endonuclease
MSEKKGFLIIPSGDVIAENVTYETFLTRFEGQHVEWILGEVIKMSPVSNHHDELSGFLYLLFRTYLAYAGGGRVLQAPMVMKPTPDFPAREPDLQIILPENFDIIEENQVAGVADLVVEIISPESQRRDRVEKFSEYERAGVREYWIIDPTRKEALFYTLQSNREFDLWQMNDENMYRSQVLPQLEFRTMIFWSPRLPDVPEILEMVQQMLKSED